MERIQHNHCRIERDSSHAISRASQEGDSVLAVDFKEDGTLYPVLLHVRAIDRYHLLCDMIDCITNTLRLSIDHLKTDTVDEIVESSIEFRVLHSTNCKPSSTTSTRLRALTK